MGVHAHTVPPGPPGVDTETGTRRALLASDTVTVTAKGKADGGLAFQIPSSPGRDQRHLIRCFSVIQRLLSVWLGFSLALIPCWRGEKT